MKVSVLLWLLLTGILLQTSFVESDDGYLTLTTKEQHIVLTLAHRMGIKNIETIFTTYQNYIFREIYVKEAETIIGRNVTYRILRIHYKRWIDEERQRLPEYKQNDFEEETKPKKGDIRLGDFWTRDTDMQTRTEMIVYIKTSPIRMKSLNNIQIHKAEEILKYYVEGKYSLSSEYRVKLDQRIQWLKENDMWATLSIASQESFEVPLKHFREQTDFYTPSFIHCGQDTDHCSISFALKESQGMTGYIVDFRVQNDRILVDDLALWIE